MMEDDDKECENNSDRGDSTTDTMDAADKRFLLEQMVKGNPYDTIIDENLPPDTDDDDL